MWNIFNLPRPKNVESGLVNQLFIAPLDWFVEVKQPTAPFLERGDEVCIFEDHTFAPGKGFLEVRLAPDKNKYQATTTGEKGAYTFSHVLEVFIPGSYPVLHSVVAGLTNIPIVAVIKDSNCGDSWYYQFGGCKHAYLTPTFNTGTETEGAKGYTAQIGLTRRYAQLYFGNIQRFEAELQVLKPIFMAPQSFSGGLDTYADLRRAYFQNKATNLEAVFKYIQYVAGDQIVTLAIANDQGFFETETWSEFPVANYADFISFVENWLLINGGGRTLVNDNGMLKVKDVATNNCFMALQVPDDLLSGAGGVLELGSALISL